MNHEKRLDRLEVLWPPAAPRVPREPVQFDRARLSEADRETYEEITAALAAVDVGPARLDERADLRVRLDALSDDDLARLEAFTPRQNILDTCLQSGAARIMSCRPTPITGSPVGPARPNATGVCNVGRRP